MRNKILKSFIYFSGFICLYGFLATRFLPLYNLVSTEKEVPGYWDNTTYGELYYFNNIKHFREDLPGAMPKFQWSEDHPELEEAEILTFGDSFIDWSRHEQISSRLQDALGVPVYTHYGEYPYEYLKKNNYQNGKPKYLVYLRTERWIPITFGQDPLYSPSKKEKENPNSHPLKKNLAAFRDFLFDNRTEELYRALLQRSYITSYFSTLISTWKFELFGYISSLTPKYAITEEKPWLFYVDQVNDKSSSFYYQHSESELNEITENIKKLSEHLWKEYKLKFVFVPVPSKFTIYHHLVDPDAEYNEFLPRLYKELDRLEILYVDLYEPFRKSEEYVFYGTDDHWTEHGVSVAKDVLKKKIIESSLYSENCLFTKLVTK